MAKFELNDIVIDRIQMGVALNSAGDVLYTLTQLQEATIETTSESKEARDKDGTLIKKFYTGKSGTFSATNALINTNIIAASTGTDKVVASEAAPVVVPFIRQVSKGTAEVEVAGMDVDSVKVVGLSASGAMATTYTKDTAASETAFAVVEGKVMLPKDENVATFTVTGERNVTEGVKITNRADEFPKTVHLVLKALGIDPCEPDVLRSIYIDIPSFQVSPDQNITLNTDSTLDYTGDMQVDYCNANGKELYSIYVPADEAE